MVMVLALSHGLLPLLFRVKNHTPRDDDEDASVSAEVTSTSALTLASISGRSIWPGLSSPEPE